MLSQNQIKHIGSLKIKKFREEHRQFIAEGHKLTVDLLSGGFSIAGIYATSGWIIANLALLRGREISVIETLPREMDRISALSTPGPVLAVVNMPDPEQDFPSPAKLSATLSLALDDIRDPGNLGTIIRVADWFGIGTVLCSESCVDVYNPKVVQATMGSISRVKVASCNLAWVIQTIIAHGKHFPVYGAFLEGESLFSQNPGERGLVLIGNESRGISPELAPLVTQKIYIPSFGSSGSGKAESLNASVAAAIICAEFRRNNLQKSL